MSIIVLYNALTGLFYLKLPASQSKQLKNTSDEEYYPEDVSNEGLVYQTDMPPEKSSPEESTELKTEQKAGKKLIGGERVIKPYSLPF